MGSNKTDSLREIGGLALPLAEFADFAKDVQIEIDSDGAIVRGTTDRRWTYVWSRRPERTLQKLGEQDTTFAAIEASLATILLAGRSPKWRSDGYTLIWPSGRPYTRAAPPEGFEIGRLSKDLAEIVDHFWGHRNDRTLPLIRRCIERGPAVCTKAENGDVVGWSLVLDDGAIGASYVLPKLRGRGIHTAQVAALASALEAEQRPILRHISREADHGLLRYQRLGFENAGETSWFDLA